MTRKQLHLKKKHLLKLTELLSSPRKLQSWFIRRRTTQAPHPSATAALLLRKAICAHWPTRTEQWPPGGSPGTEWPRELSSKGSLSESERRCWSDWSCPGCTGIYSLMAGDCFHCALRIPNALPWVCVVHKQGVSTVHHFFTQRHF